MALILIESLDDAVDGNWSGTAPTYGTTARTGKAGSWGNVTGVYTLPANVTGFVMGCALRVSAFTAATNNANASFLNTSAVQLSVGFDVSGHIALWRGGPAQTLIGTGATVFPANSWNYVETKVGAAGFADTGGICQVRVNGALEIDYAGDTLFTASSPASLNRLSFAGSTTQSLFVDDLYLLDLTGSPPFNDYLGDCKVEQLLPSGAGASTQWTPTSGANYTTVDETPPSSTDYVESATSGQRDLYAMSDLVTTSGVVLAVRPSYYVAKSDTGADPPCRPVLRGNDGTVKSQTNLPAQSTTYVVRAGAIETTQPNGSAWTITDVNGLQVGQEIV